MWAGYWTIPIPSHMAERRHCVVVFSCGASAPQDIGTGPR